MASLRNFQGKNKIPLQSKSAAYTFVLGDANEMFLHPSADTSARTWTIPANSSVPFEVGTEIYITNQASAGVVTIAITTDTLTLLTAGTTSTVAIAANGYCTLRKVTSTKWVIFGGGLT